MRSLPSIFASLLGCAGSPTEQRIEVAESNELGIVALELAHHADADAKTFELRGVDPTNRTVASIRLRRGTIADLQELLPGPGNFGSEIITSIGETGSRMVSRDTEIVHLEPQSLADRALLQLDAVATALEEQRIVVGGRYSGEPGADVGYMAADTCPASLLLTTPTANYCCYSGANPYVQNQTWFVRPSDGRLIIRYRNPYVNGCKASDGVSSCSGEACYYGPLGFSRAQVYTNNYIYSDWVWFSEYQGEQLCQATSGGPGGTFSNVVGTYPAGAGCPGGTCAGCWDY